MAEVSRSIFSQNQKLKKKGKRPAVFLAKDYF